jgi:ATP-dependent exoDNAse (exonuclease V) alpha subunit
MNDITEKIKLDMYLTDIATFTTSSNYITSRIPILDMSIKSNLEDIENIKNIVRGSYEVKIILNKQDEHELKAINKMLNEDDANTTTPQKYITMSQMFGHYLNHIITSTYLEVDYGYALTVHKSQGSTYDDVYIEYNNLLANKKDTEKYKLLYTAITRCSNKLHIYY